MRPSILLLLFFTTIALHAQPVSTPSFTLQHLQSGIDSIAILTSHQGKMVRVGTVIRETIINATSVVRIEHLAIGESALMTADSFLLDRKSLQPIASYKQGDHPRNLIFTESSISIIDADSTRMFPHTTPVFYANSIDLLLQCLPLRIGYTTTLSFFSEHTSEPIEATISVTGKEKVRTDDGGTCEAYIVEVKGTSIEGKYSIDVAMQSLIRYDGAYAHLLRIRSCAP